ncbi:hypothetical protein R6Q57_021026 [Mikania cordata]
MKLETSVERKGVPLLKNLKYFPSGSVAEGVGAALLACCQMKNRKASLCVSWPESGGSVTSMVQALLLKVVLHDMELRIDANSDDEGLRYSALGYDFLLDHH